MLAQSGSTALFQHSKGHWDLSHKLVGYTFVRTYLLQQISTSQVVSTILVAVHIVSGLWGSVGGGVSWSSSLTFNDTRIQSTNDYTPSLLHWGSVERFHVVKITTRNHPIHYNSKPIENHGYNYYVQRSNPHCPLFYCYSISHCTQSRELRLTLGDRSCQRDHY